MATWEYKIVEFNRGWRAEECEEILNTMGRDGWELVAVVDESGFYAYLKRRKD